MMAIKGSEIIEELKTVLSSKTIDAILPPLFLLYKLKCPTFIIPLIVIFM